MVGMSGDSRAVDRLASRQYGCFSVNQVRAAGFDKRAVSRRIAVGSWVTIAPGVYAVASSPPSWERQLSAAVLSRPRAIVGGPAAAALQGIAGFGKARPVIIVPRTGNARSPIARVIRSAFFKTIETERLSGFSVTTVAETVLTLAGDLTYERLDSLVDDCLLTGKLRLDDFEPIYERISGGRVAGSGRLREIIDYRSSDGFEIDSTYLERLLERVLSDPRIPAAIREYPTTINGRPARLDAFIEEWAMDIEADGRRWHARLKDNERDRARDNALAMQGIQVIRLTYDKLKNDPTGCVETVLGAGVHRGPALSA